MYPRSYYLFAKNPLLDTEHTTGPAPWGSGSCIPQLAEPGLLCPPAPQWLPVLQMLAPVALQTATGQHGTMDVGAEAKGR